MKKICVFAFVLFSLILLPLFVSAEPYYSANQICVVEKKGDGYWFLNGKELAAKSAQVFGNQRNQFEWFFTEDEQIVAKVYPALRDAIIQTPDDLYKQKIRACRLTDTNQKLASSVSFAYNSKDRVCACIFEQGKINCSIKAEQLAQVPYEKWVVFFETGSFPHVIEGIVPPVLFKAWIDSPDDCEYKQAITRCSHNTSNDDIIKELEPQVRSLRR